MKGLSRCSPDKAAAEGFFGRLKQEFFHQRSFTGVSVDRFIGILDKYMVRYRDRRIRTEYGKHHGPATQARPRDIIGKQEQRSPTIGVQFKTSLPPQ